jgi:hypothetical protein
MKKQTAWLLAVLAALALAGCANQKAPAEAAIANAETAIAPIRDAAQKYVPDQMQAVDAQLASMKAADAKGDYKAVLAAAPGLNTAISSLKEATAAKQQEADAATAKAKEGWGPLSAEVPKNLDAIQSRVDILSKGRHLPKGVTKESLASAKTTLDAMKSQWSEAQNAATAGDFSTAMSKGQGVKDQATETMKSLGMTSG